MTWRAERTGRRTADRLFSEWYREALPRHASMIDLDFVSFCGRCWQPLVLIETAIDNGEAKPSIVTRRLALGAGAEAFVLLLRPTDDDRRIVSASLRAIAPAQEDYAHEVRGDELRDELVAARLRAAAATGCSHEAHR